MLLCLVAWAASAVACAHAQAPAGGVVSGRVVDGSGRGIAGVRIVFRAPGVVRRTLPLDWLRGDAGLAQAETGTDGSFTLLGMPPGAYLLVPGPYARAEDGAWIVVNGGETAEVPLVLEGSRLMAAGPQTSGGEDTAAPTKEDTAASAAADPGFDAAAAFGPARSVEEATADSTQEQDAGSQPREARPDEETLTSVDGMAPAQNAGTVDGVSAEQSFRGGLRGAAAGGVRKLGSEFRSGATRSLGTQATRFSAASGGIGWRSVANTRGGGATWHGKAAISVQQSAWAATNPFASETHFHDGLVTSIPVKPHAGDLLLSEQVGGPLRWRGTAVFAAAEQRLRTDSLIASPADPGFYSLSATQNALLRTRGVSSLQQTAALNYLDSLTGAIDRSARQNDWLVRADQRFSSRRSAMLSYARLRTVEPAAGGDARSAAVVPRGRASVGDGTIHLDGFTASWVEVLSPRFLQEFHLQIARDLESELPRSPLPQEPAISAGGFAPQVSIDGGAFTFGTPASLPRNAYPDERRQELADIVQLSAGRHLWTAGGDWSRIEERIDTLRNQAGSFSYNSGATGGHAGGIVDWITDYAFNVRAYPNGACPSIHAAIHYFCFRSFTQSFAGSPAKFALHQVAGFMEDHWRLRDGLTAQLGLRYEYFLLPLPQHPNGALDATFGNVGGTNSFPEDRNNIGPRIALAWSPSLRGHGPRQATVHLGYGVFYGRLTGATVSAALEDTALPASSRHVHITPSTITACPQVAAQGFGYPCAYVSAAPAAVAATSRALLFAKGFRLPAVQRAELMVERSFGRRLALRAAYETAMATQLAHTTDINISGAGELRSFALQGGDGSSGVRDGETFYVPVYTQRITSQFGPVSALVSNANATWHAGRAEAYWRGSGLQARAAYTWSKAIDYGPAQGAAPRADDQFDPLNVRYDKGLADHNFPQRLVGFVAWKSPSSPRRERMRLVLGGWQIAALGSAASGRPYSYEIFGGTRLNGGPYSINGSGGATYLPTVGRNTLRMLPRWNADVRLSRSFRAGERGRGELYAEVFNVANHRNISRVNARAFLVGNTAGGATQLVFQNAAAVQAEGLNTPAFGQPTSSTTGTEAERRAALGFRFSF